MSSNPEIGVRARSGEARECLRQEIQEIALNPITSETPRGDVYETFRGGGGGYRRKKKFFEASVPIPDGITGFAVFRAE